MDHQPFSAAGLNAISILGDVVRTSFAMHSTRDNMKIIQPEMLDPPAALPPTSRGAGPRCTNSIPPTRRSRPQPMLPPKPGCIEAPPWEAIQSAVAHGGLPACTHPNKTMSSSACGFSDWNHAANPTSCGFGKSWTRHAATTYSANSSPFRLSSPMTLLADGGQPSAAALDVKSICALDVLAPPETFEDWLAEQRAVEIGEQAIREGTVGVVLVAGGQGTRLNFDGPKVHTRSGRSPDRTLFQIHLEKVLALSRRFGAAIPIWIMTSPENHESTATFLEEHHRFGLEANQVALFRQGTMPAVDARTGRILLADKDCLALSPNGHGGVLQALADGGHLDTMRRDGIRRLFYFQVDNPLVKIADSAFVGRHIQTESELSLKIIRKRTADERLGVVVEIEAAARMIEYSDFAPELAECRNLDGALVFDAGSIAVHLFDVAFLTRLAKGGTMLPYHRALKRVAHIDDDGRRIEPAQANAIKFELFIFDALPLAQDAGRRDQPRRGIRTAEERRRRKLTGHGSPGPLKSPCRLA